MLLKIGKSVSAALHAAFSTAACAGSARLAKKISSAYDGSVPLYVRKDFYEQKRFKAHVPRLRRGHREPGGRRQRHGAPVRAVHAPVRFYICAAGAADGGGIPRADGGGHLPRLSHRPRFPQKDCLVCSGAFGGGAALLRLYALAVFGRGQIRRHPGCNRPVRLCGRVVGDRPHGRRRFPAAGGGARRHLPSAHRLCVGAGRAFPRLAGVCRGVRRGKVEFCRSCLCARSARGAFAPGKGAVPAAPGSRSRQSGV